MIGILLTVLVAALVYLVLAALTVPIVGIIGAILVLFGLALLRGARRAPSED